MRIAGGRFDTEVLAEGECVAIVFNFKDASFFECARGIATIIDNRRRFPGVSSVVINERALPITVTVCVRSAVFSKRQVWNLMTLFHVQEIKYELRKYFKN